MALWLYRTGKYGEHEQKFLKDSRIYLTWREFADTDPTRVKNYDEIIDIIRESQHDSSEGRIGNQAGQVWSLISAMKPGDCVVIPLKSNPAIAIGEITNEFAYDPNADPLYRCWRGVKWLNQEVPRSVFDQDLLYSFGAIQTLCQIQRNDAEKRIRK